MKLFFFIHFLGLWVRLSKQKHSYDPPIKKIIYGYSYLDYDYNVHIKQYTYMYFEVEKILKILLL